MRTEVEEGEEGDFAGNHGVGNPRPVISFSLTDTQNLIDSPALYWPFPPTLTVYHLASLHIECTAINERGTQCHIMADW